MKKTIYWLIQSNQLTPTIAEFLKTLKERMEPVIELRFIVPETSPDLLEICQSLNPSVFKVSMKTATRSYQVYLKKKEALNNAAFSDGLRIEDTLLLDDLSGGNTRQATLELPFSEGVRGLVLQVPTPLGSSDSEETVYQAAVYWASRNRIPCIGYELLPLDTKWMLAASLPDGIITNNAASYSHLKKELDHDNIWWIPEFESAIFSPIATHFHLNGARASYHVRNQYRIPSDRTILYIPHNVAMNYEYKQLLNAIKPCGQKIHLMFGVGKDQVRGAYSHPDTIKILYKEVLEGFASYSFHETSSPWEMMVADAVVACASCFNTMTVKKDLPCIVYDPHSNPHRGGLLTKSNDLEYILEQIRKIISNHAEKIEFADILIAVAHAGAGQ